MNNKTTKEIRLRWNNRPLLEFIADDVLREKLKKSGGIYIWVENYSDGRVFSDGKDSRPAYIGKATSKTGLWKRQLQWYFMQINGQSRMPIEFRSGKPEWEFKASDKDCIDTITNITSFKALVDEAFNYVKHITVFWAELTDEELNEAKCDLSEVEYTLIWQLKPWSNTSGKKSKPTRLVTIEHDNEIVRRLSAFG